MKSYITILTAAGAIALAPALAMAAPPSGGGGPAMRSPTTTTTTTRPAPSTAPAHTTGQPMQSCETTGSPPGASASASGSAFSPNGTAGTKYAGEQPQNSRNSASVSQYDVACANQPK